MLTDVGVTLPIQGKIVLDINDCRQSTGDNVLVFACADGTRYRMQPDENRCELATLERVVGDTEARLRAPLLVAQARYAGDDDAKTLYEFRTEYGSVLMHWRNSAVFDDITGQTLPDEL